MHELSLYGHVPSAREPLVRRLLSSVAAMPPDRLITHHLVFKPRRPRPQPGTSAQTELYTLQLVAEIKEDAVSGEEGTGSDAEVTKKYLESKKWSLRLNDIPEGGKRPVTSRTTMSSAVTEGDILAFMNNLGYNYVSAYITSGHRLIHNNVIITLTEILTFPQQPGQHIAPAPPPIRSPFPLEKMPKLDPEGSFMLHASVRLLNGTDVESTNTAINELRQFAGTVKGAVELEIGDRLAMDTRIK